MKISIAHPNASYVEATRQVISVQNDEYNPIGATSLKEVQEQFTNVEFDILLIDSELANGHHDSFTETLKKISRIHPTILTVNEDDEQIFQDVQNLGVFEFVVKKKGYLSALSESLKRAAEFKVHPDEPLPEPMPVHDELPIIEVEEPKNLLETDIPHVQSGEIGYFVCDRKRRFLSANEYIEDVAGYTNAELLELTIDDVLASVDDTDFFNKILNVAIKKPAMSFEVYVIAKTGEKIPAKLQISLIYDDNDKNHVIGFRGNLVKVHVKSSGTFVVQKTVDQKQMISEVIDIIHRSYSESIEVLLKNLSELVCQVFGFKRSTVALLDPRKHAYVKQAMVGYSARENSSKDNIEVPQRVIDKVFADKSRIKVIYHNKERRQLASHLNNELVKNDSQETSPIAQWHKRDLIILNLADKNNNTFGYISLDEPGEGNTPTKSTFYNLELFSRLVSVTVENYYRISTLERRNRRMKQILVNSNVFKLYYSLSELLKEVVWSVKFSLDFNLVSLVLISKKSGMLETKAVACDDKIKLAQIKELNYNLKEYSQLLRKDYLQGKSYLVQNQEPVFDHLKRIYYGSEEGEYYEGGWPNWAVVIVPIKSKEEKIIGFLMADDPNDCRMPNKDTLHTLEILANQIAIAIDNRVMYVQAKEQIQAPQLVQKAEPQKLSSSSHSYNTEPVVHQPVVQTVQQSVFNDPTEVNDNIQDYNQEEIEDEGGNGSTFNDLANVEYNTTPENTTAFDTSIPEPPEPPEIEPEPQANPSQDNSQLASDYFADADFTKTGFKKLVERFLR